MGLYGTLTLYLFDHPGKCLLLMGNLLISKTVLKNNIIGVSQKQMINAWIENKNKNLGVC